MQRPHTETFIAYEHDKYEDWVILAPKIYGGRHNINRVFKHADGSATVANAFAGYDDQGQEVIINDISKLKRVHVVISEAKENDYLKQAEREMDVAALTAITPTPQSDIIRAPFECSLANRMDFTDDVEKENVKVACEKRMKLANATADLQILQMMSQGMQIKQQMVMMQTGVQPGQPGQTPAVPGPAGVGAPPPPEAANMNPQDQMNQVRSNVPPVARNV
jgi:hypothetical protein